MKKVICSVLAMIIVLTGTVSNVLADGSITTEAEYDLEVGGTQIFTIRNENGEECRVTIEEMPCTNRVANGSYKVSYQAPGLWTAGFYVDVTSNQFSRVYSAFYTPVLGSISSPVLTKVTNTRATLRFLYQSGVTSISTGVLAKISGTTLSVSGL